MDLPCADDYDGAGRRVCSAGGGKWRRAESEHCKERGPGKPFKIKVVDAETGRGIPLVELKTTNNVLYYTDSAGVVAFSEPGLMDQPVFFHLSSHGYDIPADMFGNRGQAVQIMPGV